MNLKEYLYDLKVQELKTICKQSNIIGISKLRKSELIDIMVDAEPLVGIPEGIVLEKSELSPIPEEVACCHGQDDPLCDNCSEEIILHIPIKEQLDVKDKCLKMFEKGKKILDNKKNAQSKE